MKKHIIFLLVFSLSLPLFAVSGVAAKNEIYAKYIDNGREYTLDIEGNVVDEIVLTLDIVLDEFHIKEGETADFLGVEVIEVEELFPRWLLDQYIANGGTVFPYCITIADPDNAEEAIATLKANEHVLAAGHNSVDLSWPEPDIYRHSGDINGNGEIDAADYILLKRHYLGTYTLSQFRRKRGDVNRSGMIDMTDYFLLKRMYFGWEMPYPEKYVPNPDASGNCMMIQTTELLDLEGYDSEETAFLGDVEITSITPLFSENQMDDIVYYKYLITTVNTYSDAEAFALFDRKQLIYSCYLVIEPSEVPGPDASDAVDD